MNWHKVDGAFPPPLVDDSVVSTTNLFIQDEVLHPCLNCDTSRIWRQQKIFCEYRDCKTYSSSKYNLLIKN